MPNIKIKQLDEKIATSGMHFGMGDATRKLEPGEVVDLPEGELFDLIWATGKVDLTADPVTRPLTYKDYVEATLCSPSYRVRGDDDLVQSEKARAAVAARLAETLPDEPAETSVVDEPAEKPVVEKPKGKAPDKPVNPRVARRQKAASEQKATT